MPDGRRRSREHWTDAMEAGPADPPAHTHRLPPVVRLAAVGLTAAVALVIVALVLIGLAVYQADQYVKGRGAYRDREAQQLEQQMREMNRQSVCDLLDQLPEGGLLERPRNKYHCGPGIPIGELTPEEQQRLNGGTARAVVPALPPGVESSPQGFEFSRGADPNAERPQPYYPTPGVAEPPATVPYPPGFPPPDSVQPSDPPRVDLGAVTDPLCQILSICPNQ